MATYESIRLSAHFVNDAEGALPCNINVSHQWFCTCMQGGMPWGSVRTYPLQNLVLFRLGSHIEENKRADQMQCKSIHKPY